MSYELDDENDSEQIYRPSNYYSDCLDMPADLRPNKDDDEDDLKDIEAEKATRKSLRMESL